MIEDKLSHDERLRLEVLAQAIALNASQRATPEKILSDASQFESWVRAE